ncbi:MAG: M23 family metallopeptidase [Terriglobales bacterium]
MCVSCATERRLLFTFLLFFLALHGAFARERGPRVEVVCPSPPAPVKIEDKQALVYELHVTNFDVVPLTLKQLEIFADTETNHPLQVITGEALSAVMMEAGSTASGRTDSRSIGPAQRAVIYLWIELAPDQPAPARLRHRMIFASGPPATGTQPAETKPAPTEATLDDFLVIVSREPAPLLGSPFDGGVWLAAGLSNHSGHRRSIFAIDGHIHSPERFAIDWVKVGPNGDSHDGTTRNENWWGYGEPIHAVADGEVTQIVDGIPENAPRVLPQPVTLDNIAGNYIVIRIASNRYVTYAHLQPGSIQVHLHDQVPRGTVIARLGNSGNSTGPHLHFQVTDSDSVLQSEGVPYAFEKFTDLGPGSDYELDKHPSIPRKLSLPADNDVIELPSTR